MTDFSQGLSGIELPRYRHLPGKNARPDSALLDSVVAQALPLTRDATASSNVAWVYGIRLFNAAFYWECHEVLEVVWMNALPNSREKYLLQTIIHLTNARLKQQMNMPRATLRLYKLATDCARRAFPVGTERVMGVSRGQLDSQCADKSDLCSFRESGLRELELDFS